MVFKLFNEYGDYVDIATGSDRNLVYAEIVHTPDGVNFGWDKFGSIEDAILYYKIKPKSDVIFTKEILDINKNKEVVTVLDDLKINFKLGTYFITNLDKNSTFILDNIEECIMYNFTINNINNDSSIYICIPNTNDISNENLIEIEHKKSCFISLFYDGINRIWKKN